MNPDPKLPKQEIPKRSNELDSIGAAKYISKKNADKIQNSVNQTLPTPNIDTESKLTEMLSTITRLSEEVKNSKDEIKNTQNISHLGFIILLVMVAFFMIQSFQQWITSYNTMNENIFKLQMHLQEYQTSQEEAVRNIKEAQNLLRNQETQSSTSTKKMPINVSGAPIK